MLGGMGGGGGGMPDIASLMQNPMLMQMAQQMMANGGMDQLLQNPSVANMVSEVFRSAAVACSAQLTCAFVILNRNQMNRAQSGGGMPSMAEIMADPNLRGL